MNQCQAVAAHLRQHGGILAETAWSRYGIRDVRKPVYLLRQAGWRIETCTDSYAGTSSPACVGHYVLVQEPGQPPVQQGIGL